MEERPLISYVVTTYNIENYVAEAVQCALAQTYSPLEIVLSDDCSDDRTFDIMREMALKYHGPHKIVLNRNERNLGITRHMNKAYLELAHGELIVAAHGDDSSLPERSMRSYKFLRDHPDVTALSFSIDAIDEKGALLKDHSAVVNQIRYYTFETGGNIPAPSRCFYKRVMEFFGPLSDDCPTEDELISFRALMLGRNAFLPEHMVTYRKHKGSSSNPENFDRFPLPKILEQQERDMEKAVNLGLITEAQKKEKYASLEAAMHIRERYRVYFAKRSLKNLFSLLRVRELSFRGRIYYLRQYTAYLVKNAKQEKKPL